MKQEAIFDWKNLSPKNLKTAQMVIDVVIDFLQLQPTNEPPFHIKIPIQKFKDEQVYLDDVNHILNGINGINLKNKEKKYEIEKNWEAADTYLLTTSIIFPLQKEKMLENLKEQKEELNNYLFFEINSTDELYRIKNLTDKQLNFDTEKVLKSKEIKNSENTNENLKPEIIVGKLVAYSDGTIRYEKDIIKLRNQLKDLCRQFMKKPDRLITIDDIKDNIIAANKRNTMAYSTIAKYVSELHNSLKIYFDKDIIFNQKEEGWYFKPPK